MKISRGEARERFLKGLQENLGKMLPNASRLVLLEILREALFDPEVPSVLHLLEAAEKKTGQERLDLVAAAEVRRLIQAFALSDEELKALLGKMLVWTVTEVAQPFYRDLDRRDRAVKILSF